VLALEVVVFELSSAVVAVAVAVAVADGLMWLWESKRFLDSRWGCED